MRWGDEDKQTGIVAERYISLARDRKASPRGAIQFNPIPIRERDQLRRRLSGPSAHSPSPLAGLALPAIRLFRSAFFPRPASFTCFACSPSQLSPSLTRLTHTKSTIASMPESKVLGVDDLSTSEAK